MSIRFQADADLNQAIVLATRQREPAVDFRSAADSGLADLSDPEVLELASRAGRILITHDRRTMPGHLRTRLEAGPSSPGVIIVSQFAPIAPVVDAILLIWAASEPAEWRNQIFHAPSLTRHNFT